ncbi:MAG: tRNA 2-thiouridine(34) synthase MnmA [Eubacteriales bacterium]
MNHNKTIAIGMSGGVDSSVTAYLLQKAGHNILGITFSFFAPCGGVDNQKEAKAVADMLGVPHHSHDLSQTFWEKVIDPFVLAYSKGQTPNPCYLCNAGVKFSPQGLGDTGATHFATGHYAKVTYDAGSDRYLLQKGKHLPKDQSYFLAGLSQEQLKSAFFPLGNFSKEQVREMAQEAKLPTATRKDSQDICFIPDGDYVNFIQKQTKKSYPKGKFLSVSGENLGEHQGIISYTVGQRRGLGVSWTEKLYVKEVCPKQNAVVLATDKELYADTLYARNLNFIATDHFSGAVACEGKIRSRHQGEAATVEQIEEDLLKITFKQPQRALTPGQAVVLYDGETVLASGEIQLSQE